MKAFAPVMHLDRLHELRPFPFSGSFYLTPVVAPAVVYLRTDTNATEQKDLERLAKARLKFRYRKIK